MPSIEERHGKILPETQRLPLFFFVQYQETLFIWDIMPRQVTVKLVLKHQQSFRLAVTVNRPSSPISVQTAKMIGMCMSQEIMGRLFVKRID